MHSENFLCIFISMQFFKFTPLPFHFSVFSYNPSEFSISPPLLKKKSNFLQITYFTPATFKAPKDIYFLSCLYCKFVFSCVSMQGLLTCLQQQSIIFVKSTLNFFEVYRNLFLLK